ncbi:hypothetical protein CsSME_00043927 [Camellia sinensis var. sinensis]|uniref:Uncharacterized protein n=1 Tax=Camellia sinensis var. sinensis TaxID=542762 RepID=A0A4S4EL50_CAMSN|nr:hypothetical protein TEA_018318 [Camellia sinensis var. sinensis]
MKNEIAQSCAACNDSNVLDLYHSLALRLFLIGTHYRSPINYSDIQLEKASDRVFFISIRYHNTGTHLDLVYIMSILFNLLQTLHDCNDILSQHNDANRKASIPLDVINCVNKFNDEVPISMLDNLHTPVPLSALSDPLKIINDLLHTRKVQGMVQDSPRHAIKQPMPTAAVAASNSCQEQPTPTAASSHSLANRPAVACSSSQQPSSSARPQQAVAPATAGRGPGQSLACAAATLKDILEGQM